MLEVKALSWRYGLLGIFGESAARLNVIDEERMVICEENQHPLGTGALSPSCVDV